MGLSFHSFPGRVPRRNEEVRGQDLEDLKGELGVDGGWGDGEGMGVTSPTHPSCLQVFLYIKGTVL
jgi:hypothetical protein